MVEVDAEEALAVRGEVAMADLPAFFERAFREVTEAASTVGADLAGPPFAYYPEPPGETMVVEAGFPVAAAAEPDGNAHRLVLPGGRAVRAMHVGPYDTLGATYASLQSWMTRQGLQASAGPRERYLSDPQVDRDPATWRTQIVWPVV